MPNMTATEDFLAKLNPQVAKAVRTASEVENEMLPLASYGLTKALGGGIGKGRFALFYGNTSAGKSALLMESAGLWQQSGLVVAYIDVEGTWDNKWAERLGVSTKEMILVRKRSVSRIYNEIRPMLEAGIDAVILDSISMMLPDAFIDADGNAKDLENHKQIGAKSKAINSLLQAMHYSNDNTAVGLISQTTTDLSGMYAKQIPDGGKKIEFATSQIIKLTSSRSSNEQIKGDIHVGSQTLQVPVGRRVECLVEKNKMAPQGRTCGYDFFYAGARVGVDHAGEIVDEAIKYGVINKSGAWFSFDDLKWQGKDKVVTHARESADFVEKIKVGIQEVEDGKV